MEASRKIGKTRKGQDAWRGEPLPFVPDGRERRSRRRPDDTASLVATLTILAAVHRDMVPQQFHRSADLAKNSHGFRS